MVKQVGKRFLSIMLAIVMVLSLLPVIEMPASAANINTGVTGLTAESSGSGSWSSSGGVITGSVPVKVTSGCAGDSYDAQTGTLTVTNSSGNTALLSFDYAIALNSGTITVDGTSVTAGGAFSKKLEAGDTVAVVVTSAAANAEDASITISNLKLTAEANVNITFKPATNGSYTVDGAAVSAQTTKTVANTADVALVAKAASGYQLLGWYNETTGSYITNAATATLKFPADATIEPKFVKSDLPVFQVGTMYYTDLNEAISYASSSGTAKITLVANGTLPAGTYNIPSGKTLLIPFDAAQTVYTTSPETILSHTNPTAFRTLTLANGAVINLQNGATMSVASRVAANGTNGTSYNGSPTGPGGRVVLNAGSAINVQNGGKLYTYGYISGAGTVTAKSGAEVWELFQIRDWRGGTATSGMADNTQKVFPMNQYYVQNIEAALTLEAGATEKVYTAINASKQAFSASTTFIGTDGMFQIVNGSLTKSFVGASDRLQIDVDGEFKINPMSLKIAGIPLIGNLNLNTTDYTLPINSNISINIKSGNSTIAQDVAFFPGSELTIAEGATITLAKGHKAYIYDQDNWGAYAGAGLHLVPVGYSVANGTTAKRTNASLVDAKIDINGTMIVAGEAYTTAGGAQIISSEGTGVYDQQAAPGTETKTYQATQSGSDISYADIPITAAKLQNADGSYVETADKKAGTDIPYVGGVWGDNTPATYTVTWLDIEDGTLLQSSEVKDGEHPVYTGETPTKADDGMYTYSFDKWMIAETGEEYTDATVVSGEDMTIYSTFTATRKTLTVTFHANNGTDATATQTLNTVEKKALDANPFTYPSYQFLGWATSASGEKVYDDKQAVEFDGDVDLYAVWERAAITVTFDANVKEGTVYGEMEPQTISVNGEKLTANAFDRFGYDFIGWNTQADGKGVDYADESLFSGDTDITLYAQWQAKTYTITWVNWNGDLLEKDENVPFGSDPSYDGADPIRPDTESKHYTFSGWNPDVVPVDGDKEYKANFTESDITYTLTFSPNAADAEGAMEPQTVKGGVNVRVNEPGYTRTGYDFIAWNTEADGSGTPYDVVGGYRFTENLTLYAQWEAKVYTVSFLNEDGTEIKSEPLKYGTAITAPDDPTKPNTAEKVYTFIGWVAEDGSVWTEGTTVTGDVTYQAKFNEDNQLYTVIWLDGDGTELTRQTDVLHDAIPAYAGTKEPTKKATEQYTYTFANDWTQVLDESAFTYTLTPVFTETVNTYTVTWIIDGEETTETYEYNAMPNHADPDKAADAQYTYQFTGWSPAITAVTGNVTYTAQFDATVNTYTVTWSIDGEETTETYAYGETPRHADPAKADTLTKTYTFAGWTPEISEVTGDVTYTAQFEETERSGWVRFDGKLYYVADGAPITGIARVEYPDASFGYAEDPLAVNDAAYPNDAKGTFLFGADGALQSDVNGFYTFETANENAAYKTDWLVDGTTVWVVNGEILWHPGEVKVDGDYYYFASANTMIRDRDYAVTRVSELQAQKKYTFNDEGKVMMYNGITNIDGTDYYYVNGVKTYAGLVKIDDDLYYINSACQVVKDRSYYVSKTNDLLPAGKYSFDADGKLIVDVVAKNGIVKETETDWYYYVDGVKVYAGLTDIDGDLYYVNSAFQVIHGKDYYVSKTNGLKDQGVYTFDADGKLVEKDTSLNGIREEDGEWYYYVDGVKTYGGLVEIDGAIYYVKTNKTVVRGQEYYVSKTNGLRPAGKYTFDADGKLVELDGIVKNGDVWTYYVNGVKTYAGLIEIDGALYYVKSDCTVVHGQDYYVSKTNGVKSAGTYTFDADGKLVELDGIVKNGDVWTYYVNGVKTYAGLIEIDGALYYVKSDCTVVHGQKYAVSKTNGLKAQGTYIFDADGKMI